MSHIVGATQYQPAPLPAPQQAHDAPATPPTGPQLTEQQQVMADVARYYDDFDTAAGRGNRDGVISDRDLQAVLDNPGRFGHLDSDKVQRMVAAADYLLNTDPDFFRELAGGDTKMDRREFASVLAETDFPEDALTTPQQAALDRAELIGLLEQADYGEVDYAAIEQLLGQIQARSEQSGYYAERLFVDELGEDGMRTVLYGLERMVADNALVGGRTGGELLREIVTPFTAAFATAADRTNGASLADAILDTASPADQFHLALLVGADDGSLSPDFIARAAEQLLVQNNDGLDNPNSFFGSQLSHLFGSGYGVETVALNALQGNPEAAHRYVTALDPVDGGATPEGFSSNRTERLDGLMRWPYSSFNDETNADLAGRVLEQALIDYPQSPGAPSSAQDLADAALWRMMAEAGDGNVPDAMKRQLAGLAAMRIEHIGDTLSAGTDVQVDAYYMNGLPEGRSPPNLLATFQSFAQEIGYDTDAASILTAAGVDYMNIQAQHVSMELSDISTLDAPQMELAFREEFSQVSTLLGAMGAGFDDARFDANQRHAALFGALESIANGAVGAGVAASPLTGGTSVFAGLALREVTGRGLDMAASATTPDKVDPGDYLRDVSDPMRQIVAAAIYNNEDARQVVLDSRTSTSGTDAGDLTLEEFMELPLVRDMMASVADPARNDVMTQLLFNDFIRGG